MTVDKRVFTLGIISACAIGLLWLTPALAQPRGGMAQQMPRYDLQAEVTLTGVVEEVTTMRGMTGRGGRMGMEGTHLMLKTEDETIEVHLGPSAFLKEKQVEVEKGDELEVVGSRVTIGESDALLAREVRKGETSWTFRDENGRPLWGMMRRQ